MKNKYLLLMMLLCFACFGVARAAVVQIGETESAFHHSPTHSGYYWYVDDVIVRQTPTCPEPTNVTVTATTSNGFTATFTPGDSNQNIWICYWSTVNEVLTNQNFFSITETTFTVDWHSALQPGTTYYLWIGALCPDETYSWSQPTTFTTSTPMTIPFNEEFADGSNVAPEGWAIYSGWLNDVMAGTATLTPVTVNNYWRFGSANGVFGSHAYFNIFGVNRKHWLVTPQVTMENNCQLSFELALTKYAGTLQILCV